MSLPLFYHPSVLVKDSIISLSEETARHIVQVLRMQTGEHLKLTDGKGTEATVIIHATAKKRCDVLVEGSVNHSQSSPALHLAIAFTKNASRNEWLLEKATELGVQSIIPIQATRSERERIRHDRWQTILVSAMLQSQQYFLPQLHELTPLTDILQRFNAIPQKLMAHCISDMPRQSLSSAMQRGVDTLLFIGPEGDFTADEIALAGEVGCTAISLGSRRLRTETAAMAVCAYFSMINDE